MKSAMNYTITAIGTLNSINTFYFTKMEFHVDSTKYLPTAYFNYYYYFIMMIVKRHLYTFHTVRCAHFSNINNNR